MADETEFGGVGGMFPMQQRAAPTMQQEVWAIYATDSSGDTETADPGYAADHIGEPQVSYTVEGRG